MLLHRANSPHATQSFSFPINPSRRCSTQPMFLSIPTKLSIINKARHSGGALHATTKEQTPVLNHASRPPCSGNPALDFFHMDPHIVSNRQRKQLYNLLESAWENNPLKTLKLIAHLRHVKLRRTTRSQRRSLQVATRWLHERHPQTLLSNLETLAHHFSCLDDLPRLLYRLVHLTKGEGPIYQYLEYFDTALAVYRTDADYSALYDKAARILADVLGQDRENLKKNDCHLLSTAAKSFSYLDSFLFRDVTKRVRLFPCKYDDDTHSELIYYICEALDSQEVKSAMEKRTIWSVTNSKPDMLLPQDIMRCAFYGKLHKDDEIMESAETLWKSLVDRVKKTGTMSETLAIVDMSMDEEEGFHTAVALGVLVSELNHHPWKGHIFSLCSHPKLCRIRGESLPEKCKSLATMDWGCYGDYNKVCDEILGFALRNKVRDEAMVKRVVVLSHGEGEKLKVDYDGLRKKFGDAGYGEPPQVVILNMEECWSDHKRDCEGVVHVNGMSNDLLQLLFTKGIEGVLDPMTLMENAIGGPSFNKLVVMD